jgi:hypothetical protein
VIYVVHVPNQLRFTKNKLQIRDGTKKIPTLPRAKGEGGEKEVSRI